MVEPTSGFNRANNAWIWAIVQTKENVSEHADWQTFIGFLSPEVTFGIANPDYNCMRLIDAALYQSIEDGDWRVKTWIDPDDAEEPANAANYNTLLSAGNWANLPAYTGTKFRPGSGETADYLVGAAVDIPLMRVEEMYLIEAEASAHTGGLAAGKEKLEEFLNDYRFNKSVGAYTCKAADMNTFNDEIIRQKRIEFWGEGVVYFDYKRLLKGFDMTYEGSNTPTQYQYKNEEGFVAPRMNITIPTCETNYNAAIINNPDPSGVK